MEDIPVSYDEHKILHKYKNMLESRYKVRILMPDLQKSDLCVSETIFVKIIGANCNIKSVQQFLRNKLSNLAVLNQETDESVIILHSDSDDDDNNETDTNTTKRPPKKKRCMEKSVFAELGNQSPSCEVSSTTNAVQDESVIILDEAAVNDFIPICTHVPSFNGVEASTKILPAMDNDIIVISSDVPSFNEIQTSTKILPATDNDMIVISSDEEDTVNSAEKLPVLPRVIPALRKLRPVVIDGSNIARTHGKPQNTFSCKGIEIAVNYFLNRGHPQVTAFVPLYRKHCRYSPVLTTDQDILERLESTQNVVFTPSRRVEGRAYACYDDRFIVELAATTGGVILSNDNYKDLMTESKAFADTIKERLLMYVFVQDILMIPTDPLGSKGPSLEEFLSFPPEDSQS